MGSALMGSAPKATFSTQPTIQGPQESILNTLSSILSNAFPYQQGGFQLGSTSLAALENQAMQVGAGPTGTQSGINTGATNALTQGLNYQAPQVTPQSVTGTNVTPSTIAAPQINSTQAFQQGVVQPMTSDFLSQALPAIAGQQGGSAGGAYSSGAGQARQTAATNLERTLGQTGSQFAYSAASANQNAAMQAALANQQTGMQAGLANQGNALQAQLANQGAGLTAGMSNQSASNNAIRDVLAALGLAPGTATLPQTELGANIGLSSATFAPYQQMIADLIAGFSPPTQQTIGVGSGGSTGLLGGLASGIGGPLGSALFGGGGLFGGAGAGVTEAGLGSSLGMSLLLSDRRAKEDIEEVGEVDGFPLYKFRYLGTPERRLGVMAQDVEKRLPGAVVTMPSGYKAVNYSAVLADVLKEAA